MMKHEGRPVYAGIDTHADTHHVAVIDSHGRPLGNVQVPATAGGYRQAVRFIGRWTPVDKVGVECTGSYGAGLTRELLAVGYTVVEVNRPNRSTVAPGARQTCTTRTPQPRRSCLGGQRQLRKALTGW